MQAMYFLQIKIPRILLQVLLWTIVSFKCPSAALFAEERSLAKNALTIEGLGPGIFYSINYENSFNNYSFLRVGFFLHAAWGFPILYNLRFGSTNHQFILGAGIVPFFTAGGGASTNFGTFFAGNIGYRWIFTEDVFLQLAFTPLVSGCSDIGSSYSFCSSSILPFGGLTLGYLF